ncbi:DUF4405 domain-containing protein [Pelagicoccus sp. SDUM812005]|uniref:DUF4405 domain-containing protein n=1 Tax=Pelagicoccus sp. SDUM812005 TaxID=3041257 RepID=UPI00280C9623|nr:DUF4405 domain-containing protein [Pelagicoccus sp. SDUM812005]MDQ8181578.1 DUF4405 domain-containing protein [Pelagicoccus sp. SDUM812005]
MKQPKLSNLTINRALNFSLWFVFCALSGLGLLIAFRLPPGSHGGRGLSALGLTRHQWGELHTWLGYALIALVFAHLLMHWRWLWQAASKKRSLWLVGGLGTGILLVLVLALLPVTQQ